MLRRRNGGFMKGDGRMAGTVSTFMIANRNREEIEQLEGLTPQQFSLIANTFFDHLTTACVLTGHKFKLPKRCGKVSVGKKNLADIKIRPIDWNTSRKVGSVVRYKNRGTSGYVASAVWDKSAPDCNIHAKGCLGFKTCIPFKRKLKQALREYNTINKYYEISPKVLKTYDDK